MEQESAVHSIVHSPVLESGIAGIGAVSPSMRAVEVFIPELAQSEVPVLLVGESGVGKKTIARRIHQGSRKSVESFRVMACATITPETVESGPDSPLADGTLFLEEIGDLNSASQGKLLEMLSRKAQ